MNKNNPLISVIMPVYNGEPYLREAIESILNQTYRQIEFIIINDGSTDNSWHVIKEYAQNDCRILALTQKNIGLTNIHKDRISSEAHSRLISTDWYASRKAEAGTAIPSAVATYRAAVRTKAADMHTKIDAADTTAKLIALYEYVNTADEGDPVVMERPLGEWPNPVE